MIRLQMGRLGGVDEEILGLGAAESRGRLGEVVMSLLRAAETGGEAVRRWVVGSCRSGEAGS